MKKIIFMLVAAVVTTSAVAHSGGTNSAGCHNDHKKGTYHCH